MADQKFPLVLTVTKHDPPLDQSQLDRFGPSKTEIKVGFDTMMSLLAKKRDDGVIDMLLLGFDKHQGALDINTIAGMWGFMAKMLLSMHAEGKGELDPEFLRLLKMIYFEFEKAKEVPINMATPSRSVH